MMDEALTIKLVQIPESDEWEVLDMSGTEPSTLFIGTREAAEDHLRELRQEPSEEMAS